MDETEKFSKPDSEVSIEPKDVRKTLSLLQGLVEVALITSSLDKKEWQAIMVTLASHLATLIKELVRTRDLIIRTEALDALNKFVSKPQLEDEVKGLLNDAIIKLSSNSSVH